MSDEEKRSPEPPLQPPPGSQLQQQPSQGEEKKDSEEEFMYPSFLTIRYSNIIGSNGTYFWVQKEGVSAVWAKDGWQIVWNGKKGRWNLLNPYNMLVGRTVKRGTVSIPPTNKKWCTRETENDNFQVSPLEVLEVLVYRKGEEVLARFKNQWYLATVFRVHKDDTVDVWWHDQPKLKSSNIPFNYLKKSRRLAIKIKFENFENVSRLARLKIPLSWKVRKLRNLIGCKTTTNMEEISMYLDDSAALSLSKKIGDLGLGSGVCLTAKKESFEVFKKEDPNGTWSQGEKCEFLCSNGFWRKGTIKAVNVSKTGIIADVETDDSETHSVPVTMWHKHLRTPGTGLQAPLPPGTVLHELPFQVGEQVMVLISKGYKKAATITTALNTAEGERPKWRVTFVGDDGEDLREYNSDVLERIPNRQQTQIPLANISVLPLDSEYMRIFDSIEKIDDSKDPESFERTLNDIFAKFPEMGDDNAINALVFSVLNRFKKMDSKALLAQKREICIHLAELMPTYRDAEISKTLPYDSKVLEPIPDPECYGEAGKYLPGARLSITLMDEFDKNEVPKGSRVVQIDKDMVNHLTFNEIVKKIKKAYSRTSVIEFVFNIGGTNAWIKWFKSRRHKQQWRLKHQTVPVPGTHTRQSVEVEPPPPSMDKFQVNEIVHVLDGEAGKKIALIVSIDGNNTYTIAYIPQNKMENLRQVKGNLLVKDPIDNAGSAQTQLQPIQRPLSKGAITLSIYSQVNNLSGDNEKKQNVSLQEVRRRLKNEYPNDNIEQILGCTLEDFFENGDQYEFRRGNGEAPPTVRLIAKFVQQEMRELNKSNGLDEGGQMLQTRTEFHGPIERPEFKAEQAEIFKGQLAHLEQTANSMCIFPTKQQLRQALESNYTLETQISHLLDRL